MHDVRYSVKYRGNKLNKLMESTFFSYSFTQEGIDNDQVGVDNDQVDVNNDQVDVDNDQVDVDHDQEDIDNDQEDVDNYQERRQRPKGCCYAKKGTE